MAGFCLLLAAVAAVALAAPAGAAVPEFGRCLKVAGKTGEYKGQYCTAKTLKPHTGAYEWMPGPGEKKKFEGLGEEVELETTAGVKVVCSASEFLGEYTGPKTETLKLVLLGCQEAAIKQNCQTVPTQEGEVTSTELEGELGLIKAGTFPVIGLDLKPKTSSTILSFQCGKFPEVNFLDNVEGSVIAPVTPKSRMAEAFKLVYKQAKGVQAVQSFEGGAKDTLTSSFVKGTETGTAGTGFKSTREDTNEEPMEIKAK
jgi:hypothetical protein